jgi:hypothetical protein
MGLGIDIEAHLRAFLAPGRLVSKAVPSVISTVILW